MTPFSNNQDLYKFLVSLAFELGSRGHAELSTRISSASRQAAGMSAEFLGESRVALRWLIEQEHGALRAQERADVLDALRQLDNAFDRRGAT